MHSTGEQTQELANCARHQELSIVCTGDTSCQNDGSQGQLKWLNIGGKQEATSKQVLNPKTLHKAQQKVLMRSCRHKGLGAIRQVGVETA